MGAPYRSASARADLMRVGARQVRRVRGHRRDHARVAGPSLQEPLRVGERVGDRLVVRRGELDQRSSRGRSGARRRRRPRRPGPRSSTCPRRWWCRSGSSRGRPAPCPPSRTAAVTLFFSAGKMKSCSHCIRRRSSAMPRKRTIGAWPWAFTSPGMTSPPPASRICASLVAGRDFGRRAHGDDLPAVDGDGAARDHAAVAVHGDDGAVGDDERHRPRRRVGGCRCDQERGAAGA